MSLGVGTVAYGIATGALAATALVFFLIAVQQRPPDRRFVSFGFFSVSLAMASGATVWMQKSASATEYADRLKVFGMVNLLAMVATIVLVQVWTRSIPRVALITLAAATVGIAALQVVLPVGLLADDVSSLRTVSLFGEPFVVHEPKSSPWRPVLDAYLVIVLVCMGAALWRRFRNGDRGEVLVLTAGVGVTVLVSMYDSLVDEGVTDTPYLAPFGGLASAAVAAWYLARTTARAERMLAVQAAELEATVIERTAALKESNLRLAEQVERERRSSARLATLAEQFEAVNAVPWHHDDPEQTEHSLRHVLHDLGHLLDADAVDLVLDDPPAPVPSALGWSSAEVDIASSRRRTEPISLGGHRLGEVTVTTRNGLSVEGQRYVELTAGHLAGFVDRVQLSQRLTTTAIDAERERIARDLHDSVTQKLYSVAFLAEATGSRIERDPAEATHLVARMRLLLLASLAELRALLFELRPEVFERATLAQLLAQLAETYDYPDLVNVSTELDAIEPLPPLVRSGFYRVAQEAISNSSRHSGANEIDVSLRESDGVVTLTVTDGGHGIRPGSTSSGYGMTNMHDRATMIGARLDVASSDRGTSVRLTWTRSDVGTTHQSSREIVEGLVP